jgi:hypothetical protein
MVSVTGDAAGVTLKELAIGEAKVTVFAGFKKSKTMLLGGLLKFIQNFLLLLELQS